MSKGVDIATVKLMVVLIFIQMLVSTCATAVNVINWYFHLAEFDITYPAMAVCSWLVLVMVMAHIKMYERSKNEQEQEITLFEEMHKPNDDE